jgi:hypothetical protein
MAAHYTFRTMTTKEKTEQLSPAEQNGRGWIESIAAAYEAHQFCASGFHTLSQAGCNLSREARACLREHGYDGTNHNVVAEWIEDAMREAALGVEVRSGWHTPGEDVGPEEFQVLLSTGGPALRMMGDLDQLGEPSRCWLEIQDWGTPWTRMFSQHEYEVNALRWFAGLFYYGEG